MWKFASIITLSLLFGCVRRSQEPLKPAFYCWQTSLALSGTALDYLASSGCRKIYVKALDVGLDPADGSIAPYSRLVMADTAGLSQLEVVPVVFITNETIRRLTDDEKTGWLAEKIASALVRAGAAGARVPRPEFQVDCDWTRIPGGIFPVAGKNKGLPARGRSAECYHPPAPVQVSGTDGRSAGRPRYAHAVQYRRY
jgi:hypothetical protein